MARIIRGKFKGQEVLIRQWANDWVSTNHRHKGIISPTSLYYTTAEKNAMEASEVHGNNGNFFDTYQFEKVDEQSWKLTRKVHR